MPLPTVIPPLVIEAPVVLKALNLNFITLSTPLIITGMNFNPAEEYYATIVFEAD